MTVYKRECAKKSTVKNHIKWLTTKGGYKLKNIKVVPKKKKVRHGNKVVTRTVYDVYCAK